jgi:outer membrane protein assembly factor BamD
VEEIYYYYAYCYYHQQDYIVASYYFKRYAKSFPTGERAEECMFMSAYSYYLDSPRYSLDQTNTHEAIKELQLFIDLFPTSDRIDNCNDLIDELRGKLEKKDFEIAKLYLRTGYYKAAIKAFNNILKEYPDTENKEEVLFYIVKSYYNYALNSIEAKQEERYQAAIEAYNDFIYLYPESEFSKEADNLNKSAYKQIEKNKQN